MRHFYYLLPVLLTAHAALAQIPEGGIASPDFTATDLNGHTWNLYDQLDQGKSVVLDIFTTWCGPCWQYHESGALKDYYATHGPDGSNDGMVFMLEADDFTTIDDLMGTGDDTVGDWITGTPYPIIDNVEDLTSNTFGALAYPTTYFVCPNRRLIQVFTPSTLALSGYQQQCVTASGTTNASLFSYDGFSGPFCGSQPCTPAVKMQNLGASPLTAATLELYLNGVLSETVHWTGLLHTYDMATVGFSGRTLYESTEITVKILAPNGITDDHEADNTISASAIASVQTNQNVLTLELRTDKHPSDIYWEIRETGGPLYYFGGNKTLSDPTEPGELTYALPNHVYTHQLALPADACWMFTIEDKEGDGICCAEGAGYYKLLDPNGNVLAQGGAFGKKSYVPLVIEGGTPIENNAGITDNFDPGGDFCESTHYQPYLRVVNQGNNDISSMALRFVNVETGATLDTLNWTGTIPAGTSTYVWPPGFQFEESIDFDIRIEKVNGVADEHPYNNNWRVSLHRNIATEPAVVLKFTTDDHGYELYWRMTNSNGETVATGGNQNIPNFDPDGHDPAMPGDPGAYGNHEAVAETIHLDDTMSDCYSLALIDAGGNGMPGTTFEMITEGGDTVFSTELLTGGRWKNIEARITTSAGGVAAPQGLTLSPNPVADQLLVTLPQGANLSWNAAVFNVLGRMVYEGAFDAATDHVSIDVSGFADGVYLLQWANGAQQIARKFVVK